MLEIVPDKAPPQGEMPSPFIELAKSAHAKLAAGVSIGGKDYRLKEEEAWSTDLEKIIAFCAENPRANFPSIGRFQPSATRKEEIDADRDKYSSYFLKYVKNYYWGRRPLARPSVNTKTDPALGIVMQKAFGIDPGDEEKVLSSHRQCMVAENSVGQLLERYIDHKCAGRGWIWCAGQTIKFADFFVPNREPQRLVLQVKNQANSENSASSTVRAGTEIINWFRRNSKTGETRWIETNRKRGIGVIKGLPDNDGSLTEEDFIKFVGEYKWAEAADAGEEPSNNDVAAVTDQRRDDT